MSKKSKLGDNPMAALTGGQVAAVRSVDKFPPVSYRLPPDIAASVKAIATAEALPVGQVAAYALAYFCDLYQRGEVRIPVKELPTVRREVDITRKQ